ncbi:trypsin-like peptidase domain-containing protein [Candidatus Saccharibacteria bacterium]|nr:trypsin-like peptidase domain-containing protein [Candidatus Saccharibacteria bacterium]
MEEQKVGSHETLIFNEPKKEKKKSDGVGFKVAVVTIASLALLLGASSVTMSVFMLTNDYGKTTVIDGGGGYYAGNSLEFETTTIANVASKVSPAVVSILTETQVRNYFGRDQISSGAGTGMIVSSDGYVLTNGHVIDGADTVTIVTDAGDTYENVQVVGVDPLNDVAYLKIPGVSDLPTVTLGDSKAIAVGQPVLAIGNALGVYQNSITQGIISGTGRSVTASDSSGKSENLSDMIQTDTAINPGNSGGPLVDAAGEVIGINTAVSTDAQGLGFAIPISSVKGMLKSIMEKGRAERAYLGVSYLTITADVSKEYKLPVKRGAYIYNSGLSSAVVKGGPADKAGMKDEDIILKVNGVDVGIRGSILSLVGEYMVGETVEMTILRGTNEIKLAVILEAYPNR